uniref:Beta-1,3-galactosyl-O-glycosyl-glycoprotein beta-1,6-N-acetylglucosaminyltransferase n=1 Tax=Arion vulgaris TaxID=1028688 RepID=A0A0B7AQP9_9EUPU
MQNSICTTPRCLAALLFVAVFYFLISLYVPQMSLMPTESFRAVFFQRNTSSNDALLTTSTSQTSTETSSTNKPVAYNINVSPNNLAKDLVNIANMNTLKDVDCRAIYSNSKSEIEKAKQISKTVSTPLDDAFYLNLTTDCNSFVTTRGYILSTLTKEEEEFPLAVSILVFKEVEMVERLLKAIYRPQNYYCVHVDYKSPDTFYRAVSAIANCFPNVFLTSRRIDVQWGWFSVLEPELQCMKELWRYPKWKYFLSLTGQEFPLKTNSELVKIFTAYDGANDIEGTIKRANKERFRSTPPLGIRPVKGSVHITVNRDFVGYILHNETAKILLEWVKKDTSVPDEAFFATLNHNPQLGIRGSYKGEPETDWSTLKPFLTRYKNWGSSNCASGVYVRGICILSLGDLPSLGNARHYFANKFYLSQDRVVIGCLEEKIFNDTRDEYLGVKTFDTTFYANLGFVKNKV